MVAIRIERAVPYKLINLAVGQLLSKSHHNNLHVQWSAWRRPLERFLQSHLACNNYWAVGRFTYCVLVNDADVRLWQVSLWLIDLRPASVTGGRYASSADLGRSLVVSRLRTIKSATMRCRLAVHSRHRPAGRSVGRSVGRSAVFDGV